MSPSARPPLQPLLDYRPALVGGQGIGRYVRELVRALAALDGVTPKLFGPTRVRPSVGPDELGLAGSRLFAPRLPSKPLSALLGAVGLGVERLLGGADVVHHTQYRRLPTRLPEVATVHDLVFLDSDRYVRAPTAARMSAFVRDVARRCPVIITPSEAVADEVATRLGVPRERVIATPLGADHVERMARDPKTDARVARDRETGGPFLFTAARIERRKNLGLVLEALERMGARAPRWKIAGIRGEGADEFEAALRRSPVKDRVELLGHVEEATLRAHMEICDAFVLVPHDEGFGLGPLEAMALGSPAITSDVPVVREVCGGGATLVDPQDADALADAIEAVALDGEAQELAAMAARDHAGAFTWQRTAKRTVEAYWLASGSGLERLPLR